MPRPRKHEEDVWISIGDLMASAVAVLVLLFIIAALQRAEAARKAEQIERAQREAREKARAEWEKAFGSRLRNIRDKICLTSGLPEDAVEVELDEKVIRLKEATFELGSPCLRPAVRNALSAVAVEEEFLALVKDPKVEIVLVEGHADSRPVRVRRGQARLTPCGAFDDNFTLSAARAREARNILVQRWDEESAKRVQVVGYGDSHPLDQDCNPENLELIASGSATKEFALQIEEACQRNRRVEIRFVEKRDNPWDRKEESEKEDKEEGTIE
jgi:chemotaxis protein MotB